MALAAYVRLTRQKAAHSGCSAFDVVTQTIIMILTEGFCGLGAAPSPEGTTFFMNSAVDHG
jgi:hypothetical protein